MFDSEIHDIQMEISRLQKQKKLLKSCEDELKEWGLEGENHTIDCVIYEYMQDTRNIYFDIFRKHYTKGW